jgi:hypothetical protein
VFEPGLECGDEWSAPFLADRASLGRPGLFRWPQREEPMAEEDCTFEVVCTQRDLDTVLYVSANIMSSRARGGSQLFDCNLSSQNLFLKKLALGNGLALKISSLFGGPALA